MGLTIMKYIHLIMRGEVPHDIPAIFPHVTRDISFEAKFGVKGHPQKQESRIIKNCR